MSWLSAWVLSACSLVAFPGSDVGTLAARARRGLRFDASASYASECPPWKKRVKRSHATSTMHLQRSPSFEFMGSPQGGELALAQPRASTLARALQVDLSGRSLARRLVAFGDPRASASRKEAVSGFQEEFRVSIRRWTIVT